MGDEQRGNKLPASELHSEYVVHGLFKRSPTDQNGKIGAYWVPLRKLLKDVGREAVQTDVDIFNGLAETVFEEEMEASDDDSDDSEDGRAEVG